VKKATAANRKSEESGAIEAPLNKQPSSTLAASSSEISGPKADNHRCERRRRHIDENKRQAREERRRYQAKRQLYLRPTLPPPPQPAGDAQHLVRRDN